MSTYFALRAGWLRPLRRWLRDPWEREHVRHFFSIALTTLVTGFVGTGSVLAVRAMFVHYGGLPAAGIFDAAWMLSMTYVMLALGSFGTYYLPTLSGVKDPAARVALIQRFLRATIMLGIPLIVGVIVFKPLLIHLLYSEEFRPALTIIRWMLIGDYLKSLTHIPPIFPQNVLKQYKKHSKENSRVLASNMILLTVILLLYPPLSEPPPIRLACNPAINF